MSIHMWVLALSTKMCLHTLVLCCQLNNNKKIMIHTPSHLHNLLFYRNVTSCIVAVQYEFFSKYITYIFPSLCHHKRNTTSSQLTLTSIYYFLPVWNIWYTFTIFLIAIWCCKTWTYYHCLTVTIVYAANVCTKFLF